MLAVNLIRKEIQQALAKEIIPALWAQRLSLGCVSPSLQFDGNINARLLSRTVPRKSKTLVDFPVLDHWPRANLHSSFYPYLGLIYCGEADERTLVNTGQAREYHVAEGVYAIHMNAPAGLLFSKGVPHSDGHSEFWDGAEPAAPRKILWFLFGTETLVHLSTWDHRQKKRVSHSLQIRNRKFHSLSELFLNEMQADSTNQQLAQSLLLSMMLELQIHLQSVMPKVVNTSRTPIIDSNSGSLQKRRENPHEEAAVYIHMHLSQSLNLKSIAKRARVSPTHLNRLFGNAYGMSVMHYVRVQRIEAAKRILRDGDENISEIARLVGFKRSNLFCRAFRQVTQLTPGQFRRKIRNFS